jgi:hypothetical protein
MGGGGFAHNHTDGARQVRSEVCKGVAGGLSGDAAVLTNCILGNRAKPPTPFSQCPGANISVWASTASAPCVVVDYRPPAQPGHPRGVHPRAAGQQPPRTVPEPGEGAPVTGPCYAQGPVAAVAARGTAGQRIMHTHTHTTLGPAGRSPGVRRSKRGGQKPRQQAHHRAPAAGNGSSHSGPVECSQGCPPQQRDRPHRPK